MIRIILLILTISQAFAGNRENLLKITDIKRFAFGSCSDQKDPQPLWKEVLKDAPDLFIHGGDNIYADTKDLSVLKAAWNSQLAQADYAAFRKVTPLIGIWDDHDFALNDSDGNLSIKKESKELFLDWMEEPLDSPRRNHEGIYTSHIFGTGDHRIKFILLDNRYFRNLEKKAPLLGETQWTWLENELKDSPAAINFIVSGISVLSRRIPKSDAWINYPGEHKRILKTVKDSGAKGIVFLTGDKHFASIFRRDGHLEFLSSGLTHNRAFWMQPFLSAFYPNATHQLNYGLVDISWTGNIPTLRMAIKNKKGKVTHGESFTLKANSWMPVNPL